jgi:hypothetical protein
MNAGRRRGRGSKKSPPPHPTESLQFLMDDDVADDDGRSSSPPLPPLPAVGVDVDVDDDATSVPRNRSNRKRSATTENAGGDTSSSSSSSMSSKRRGKDKPTPTPPTLSSDPRLVRALAEATYEARVDPYRGIAPFFSLSSAIDGKNNADCNNRPRRHGGTVDDDRMMEDEGMGGGGGGGGGMVGIPPMISERPLLHSSTDDVEREWACERCTLLNSRGNANCEACGASRHAAGNPIDDVDDDEDDDCDDFRGGGGKDGGIVARRRRVGGRTSNTNRSSSGFAIDVGNSPDAPARHARAASRSSTMRAKDGSTAHDALVDPDEARSPWLGCRDAVFVVSGDNHDGWSFRSVGRGREEGGDDNTTANARMVDVDADADDVVIDDGERGRREGGDDTTDDGTVILVKCGCPTVDGWAEAELEEYSKRLVADAKRIGKRKKGGAGGRGAVVALNECGRGKRDDGNFIDKSQNDRHGPETVHSAPSSREAHLICGGRKRDAGMLHPCDFNPVSDGQ